MGIALGLYLLSGSLRLYSAWNTMAMVVVLLLYLLGIALSPRARWATLGLCRLRSLGRLAMVVLLVLVVYAAVIAVQQATFGNGEDNWVTWIPTVFAQVPGGGRITLLIIVLAMGIIIPLVEEGYYRGMLQTTLAERYGVGFAIVITSALWAFVHLGNYGLVPFNGKVIAGLLPSVFCMGIALGVARVATGSVLGSAIAQGGANLGLVAWAVLLNR